MRLSGARKRVRCSRGLGAKFMVSRLLPCLDDTPSSPATHTIHEATELEANRAGPAIREMTVNHQDDVAFPQRQRLATSPAQILDRRAQRLALQLRAPEATER